MTEGQGQGGGKRQKPADDRTLLDPLNEDELKALRQARQRMQAKKAAKAAAQKPSIAVGPDAGDPDIGDAPTRGMPALPQFEGGGMSLDQIQTGSFKAASPARDPAEQPSVGGPPSEPMSMPGTSGTRSDAGLTRPLDEAPAPRRATPAPRKASGPGRPLSRPGGPKGNPPGFGENTLLWMQPPKVPNKEATNATGDIVPKADKKAAAARRLKTMVTVGLTAAVVAALLFVTLKPTARGAIELHTNPPKASVKINGSTSKEVTPVKLTLKEGEHELEVALEGHEPQKFMITIVGEKTSRKDVDLIPISQAGMLTVSINVQPVVATVKLDETVHSSTRKVMVPNLDPQKAHKISIEANGYIKLEQEIPAGQLKAEYNFMLQQDKDQKPM